MATAAQQKALGAFYTADPVARFLVNWAVRERDDVVLDPSCGDGVFLSAAAERIVSLGNPRPKVWGVDVDPEALRCAYLRTSYAQLVEKDFFSLRAEDLPAINVVVGNPPFIRYQRFAGQQRRDAQKCASASGVDLPGLSSSWAPFLVHAAALLRERGRMAMVVPAEFVHAKYAKEVLRFLLRRFQRINVRMFQKKMFPELSEDTLLLLCEECGRACDWFSVTPSTSIENARADHEWTIPVDIESIQTGQRRLSHYLLPHKARHLYEALGRESGVSKLGDAADVGIGYVTGCNHYFHMTAPELRTWRFADRFVARAVLSLGSFDGTVLRLADWRKLANSNEKVYLLKVPPLNTKDMPTSLSRYLAQGREQRIPERFKCRVRDSWYSVPHVRVGDALLSYMSGSFPKLVRNAARLVAPNTLHIVRFGTGRQWRSFVAGWHTSLTRLSCEIEGHPLGGGLLKLEPGEAESVLVALPHPRDASRLVRELDQVLRRKDYSEAAELADRAVLRRRFGLSGSECLVLRDAAKQLESWRLHK
jgi:adenine-specific DNA-methyltransferase